MSRVNKIRVTFVFDVATFETKNEFAANHLGELHERLAEKVNYYARDNKFIASNDIIEFDLGKR